MGTRSTASFAGSPGPSPSTSRAASSMEHVLHPQPGYPFSLALRIEYAALGRRAQRPNDGDECRARIRAPTERRASVLDRRDGDRRPGDPAGTSSNACCTPTSAAFPIGTTSVDGTEFDFRRPRPIGTTSSTTLHRPRAGRGRPRPRRAPRSRERVRADPVDGRGLRYLMLFTGDPLPDVAPPQPRRRADDLPAERVPDRRGSDPTGAGDSFTGRWGLDARDAR